MPATLTIPVSDAVLARLQTQAAAQGTTPEAVAAAELERPGAAPQIRPSGLRALCGTLTSDLADASVRTEEYLTGGPGHD